MQDRDTNFHIVGSTGKKSILGYYLGPLRATIRPPVAGHSPDPRSYACRRRRIRRRRLFFHPRPTVGPHKKPVWNFATGSGKNIKMVTFLEKY